MRLPSNLSQCSHRQTSQWWLPLTVQMPSIVIPNVMAPKRGASFPSHSDPLAVADLLILPSHPFPNGQMPRTGLAP